MVTQSITEPLAALVAGPTRAGVSVGRVVYEGQKQREGVEEGQRFVLQVLYCCNANTTPGCDRTSFNCQCCTAVLLYCHCDLRVWKGKKMPGRLGNERMTFKNIWLWKVRGLT